MRANRGEQHADWLALVEPEGQFLSIPELKRAFPTGLTAVPSGLRARIRDVYPTNDASQGDRDAWIDTLLRDVLEWGPRYQTGDARERYRLALPEYDTVIAADAYLNDPEVDKPRVLLMRYPLDMPPDSRLKNERWNATPVDRMTELCRANGVRIGMIVDGQNICVVWVPESGIGGHAVWDTSLFLEAKERSILQAFLSLFNARQFFAVAESERIEALFKRSASAQAEVTKHLGRQVRDAVELLVSSISEKNLARGGELLRGIAPRTVYEAAVTVMMRIVFLLFAEERGLLPLDDGIYSASYSAFDLRQQLLDEADAGGDEPMRLHGAAWFRLLALSRVIFGGTHHDRLNLPAYGGRLFDPQRFPFLETFPIDDLTILAVLTAIQTLPIAENGSKERRRLSFRTLDVEQIGHVYEGLLDHSADRIDATFLGLRTLAANAGDDEITLAEIEERDRARVAGTSGQPLVSFLADRTGRSPSSITKDVEKGRALAEGKDPEKRRLLRSACENDDALTARVAPYTYLLRENLQELPAVYTPGSLIVRRTRTRRASGTEYTPRELAEEMVRYALEPLCYAPKLRTSAELLALKICDPAVGSGAFLVAACRYLADRVVEAWLAEEPSKAVENRDDLTLRAKRLVVDRCLYGVDIDAMAVDMTKLSLWLTTMARERPFSFLDHTIRNGDSLLGIHTLDQLRYLHINPGAGKRIRAASQYGEGAERLARRVDEAAGLSVQLESIPADTIRQAREKEALHRQVLERMAEFNALADTIVGIALAFAESDRKRDREFQGLGPGLLLADGLSQHIAETTEQYLQFGRPEDGGPPRTAFHWPLAFPEVFTSERERFDVLVGNPPFMGGKKISGNLGANYREYLATYVCPSMGANTDLVAVFVTRCATLAGMIAVISAKTIAEAGDTRRASIEVLLANSWQIFRAVRKRPWPGEAGVTISQLWLTHASEPERSSEQIRSGTIGLDLREERGLSFDVKPLSSNQGIAFQGVTILGDGFCLTPSQAQDMIALDGRNAEVLAPYVNTEDICDEPCGRPTRYVVDFGDASIELAESYLAPFSHVLDQVYPVRMRKSGNSYKVARERWWQFWRRRPELRTACAHSTQTVAMPRHSKHVIPFAYGRERVLFSDAVVVIVDLDGSLYSIVSSTVHRSWALRFSGSIDGRPRYTPTGCFETFPLPRPGGNAPTIMSSIDVARRSYMDTEGIGLTKVYNKIHDGYDYGSAINALRDLHAKLDRAICDDYGWSDIDLGYDFHKTDEGVRWTMSEASREEVLRRLLELNHERHAEEIAAGTAPGARGADARRGASKTSGTEALSLFPQP